MNKNLIIRVDASTQIGTGHIMRCIALAQTWQDQGGDITFLSHCDSELLGQRIINEGFEFIPIKNLHPDPSDIIQTLNVLKRHAPCSMPYALWLAVDGYHFTPDYHKAIRKNGYKLLVIDDMNHLPHYHANILLNQNIHASSLHYSCDRDTVKLLGCEYVLLRREFLKYKDWKRDISDKAKKILVTMGGADPGNETLKVIRALNSLNDPDLEVKIVAGPANPNINNLEKELPHSPFPFNLLHSVSDMPRLMAWADVAVSAAGSTCWELAFMGLPFVIIVLAMNQEGIANGLQRAEVTLNCNWFQRLSVDHLAQCVLEMISDPTSRINMAQRGRKIVDGFGLKRIIEEMMAIR